MPEIQQTIFQFKHTAFITCQPTKLCMSLICQGQGQYPERCSLQIRKASSISIPTSIAPNVWIVTLPTAAVPLGITPICPGETPRSVLPQNLSMYFNYNLHATPHHSSFIYHHAMNFMKALSTSHWTQPISMLLTYQHWNSEYGST